MDLELAAYLKDRRAAVTPEAVGLPGGGIRRVTGLRREEVAMLAGVSVDYLTRLEQGRERNPSPAVLNALGRALALDTDGSAHLFRLAGLAPAAARAHTSPEVDASLRALLEQWPHTPAIVLTLALETLAMNPLAAAVFSDFERTDNYARMVFLDPVAPRFFDDWDRSAESSIANLRLALGHDSSDQRTVRLIAELQAGSLRFAQLWNRRNARGKGTEAKRFHHSEVGALDLEFTAFEVRSAPDQQLIVYRAVDDASADRLRILGSLHAEVAAGAARAVLD